jgi:hypothetical protein
LRSIDEGNDAVMDSPTSGDTSHGGYKNRPVDGIISYASGGYPNGVDSEAVDRGGSGRVTEEPELPAEAMPTPVASSFTSALWP